MELRLRSYLWKQHHEPQQTSHHHITRRIQDIDEMDTEVNKHGRLQQFQQLICLNEETKRQRLRSERFHDDVRHRVVLNQPTQRQTRQRVATKGPEPEMRENKQRYRMSNRCMLAFSPLFLQYAQPRSRFRSETVSALVRRISDIISTNR